MNTQYHILHFPLIRLAEVLGYSKYLSKPSECTKCSFLWSVCKSHLLLMISHTEVTPPSLTDQLANYHHKSLFNLARLEEAGILPPNHLVLLS